MYLAGVKMDSHIKVAGTTVVINEKSSFSHSTIPSGVSGLLSSQYIICYQSHISCGSENTK
jgi:hypothetical protein